MKTFLFAILALTTIQAFASTKDLECFGTLTKDESSRRSHLTFNEDTNQLRGYKASMETGGIEFTANQNGDYVFFKMTINQYGKDVVIAAARLPLDSAMKLTMTLEKGTDVTLECSKELSKESLE